MQTLSNLLKEENSKITDQIVLNFASQEFSRKISEWRLYYVKTVDVPNEVEKYLCKTRILAGGAVLSLYFSQTPRDWDIFFLKEVPTKFIEQIRKKKNCYESYNAITIGKVQFIKRIYERADQVIGGFDLDPCRLFMNHRGEIYGTANALRFLESKIIYVNPACQSKNFAFRVNKYSYKGYKIVHPCAGKLVRFYKEICDYVPYIMNLANDIEYDLKPHEFIILGLLLSNKADTIFKRGKLISLKRLHKLVDIIELYDLIYYTKGFGISKEMAEMLTKEHIKSIITEEYPKYANITNFMVSNTSSQFTASFNPTNFLPSELYGGAKYDIFHGLLRVSFLVVKFSGYPKYLIYKIFTYVFN